MSGRAIWFVLTAMLLGALAWGVSQTQGAAGAREWLVQHAWLGRLLSAHRALLAVGAAWAVLREPYCPTGPTVLCGLLVVASVLELKVGLALGLTLAVLAGVALAAKPWPNQVIARRCLALGGFAIAVSMVYG